MEATHPQLAEFEQIPGQAPALLQRPDATAQPENAPTEATGEQQQEQQESQPRGGVRKRIDKLTREKYTAKAEAQFWKEKALLAGYGELSDDMPVFLPH